MKTLLINILKIVGLYKTYKVPKHVSKNFIKLDESKFSQIQDIIYKLCSAENYKTTENRLADIDSLLTGRLEESRNKHIPFLIEKIGIKGKRILEIGCGTGSTTLALAEQGAIVTGLDISESAIQIAKKRLDIYGVNANFEVANATEIKEKNNNRKWDIIIFFASLEHMTNQERIVSIQNAYNILNDGGHLCIFNTPNRLWPFDIHTSYLPFYHWLQDEIAIAYSPNSERKEFSFFSQNNKDKDIDLYRWGRGASYHEVELAIKPASELKVIGSVPIFLRKYSFIQTISYKRSSEYKYKKILAEFGPKNLHPGFYECYLDIMIEKN